MPETPQDFFARVAAAAESQADGRLAVPAETAGSTIFPFEAAGLQVKEFERPVVPEPPRAGEPGGAQCERCQRGEGDAFWADERWLLTSPADAASLPFAALLQPRAHVDVGDLDERHSAELGALVVAMEHAVKDLGNVGRVHVNIWGDGGSHLHVWFLARPLGQLQLRGSCLPLWIDLLPDIDAEAIARDRRAVAVSLVGSYGGRAMT